MSNATENDFPKTPSAPSQAPEGYVTPTGATASATPPKTSAEVAAHQNNFWQFTLGKVNEAVQGFFHWGDDAFDTLQQWGTTLWDKAEEAAQDIADMIADIGGSIATDISNTIKTVGGLLDGLKNNLLHAAHTVIGDISGVVADGSHFLQDIWDAVGAGLGGGSSGHSATTLNVQAMALADQAQKAEASAYTAQLAIAALTKGLDESNDGAVFDLDFVGADGAALNATDWPTTGPTSGDLCIRVLNTVVLMGVRASNATNSTYYAYCGHLYETNDQLISAVIGGSPDSVTTTKLHFHCDSAKSRGIYLSIGVGSLTLGYFTTSGSVRTYTPFGGNGTVNTSLSSGMRIGVRNVGNQYQIMINGSVQPTYVDTANKAVAGDFYSFISIDRHTTVYNAGLPWQTSSVHDGFYLSEILVSDYAPIVYQGSGARMYRTSTANVGVSAGTNILANNVFSVNGASTSDITVNLTAGKFTVSQPGWYFVTMRLALTASSDSGSGSTGVGYNVTPFPMQMTLFRNGSLEKYVGATLRAFVTSVGITGGGNTISIAATGPEAAYGSTSVYLNAGDYVQIGYVANSADTTTFTGEATGTKTYFEIQGKTA